MLQIKTIHVLITLSPKPPTEQFDQRVNEALAEGWRLTKRICYETAFIAELEKEVITDEEKCCDNCMGSGSTGVAVKRVGGRHFIGIERDKGYFEIAQKRINEV